MATADVGIGMCRSGSDLAMETADAILVRDDLAALPKIIDLSRRAHRVVKANLVIAVTVITGLVLWDVLGTLPSPSVSRDTSDPPSSWASTDCACFVVRCGTIPARATADGSQECGSDAVAPNLVAQPVQSSHCSPRSRPAGKAPSANGAELARWRDPSWPRPAVG